MNNIIEDINNIITEFLGTENPDYLDLIKIVNDKYLEKYGATKRVRDFTNRYLQTKTKIILISSFKTKKTIFVSGYSKRDRPELKVKNIEELKKYGVKFYDFFMPECYNWKECYINGRNCAIDKCPLNHDKDKLEKKPIIALLDEIGEFIPKYRVMRKRVKGSNVANTTKSAFIEIENDILVRLSKIQRHIIKDLSYFKILPRVSIEYEEDDTHVSHKA